MSTTTDSQFATVVAALLLAAFQDGPADPQAADRVETLDSLPLDSVVMDADLDLWVRDVDGWRMVVSLPGRAIELALAMPGDELTIYGPYVVVRVAGSLHPLAR